jgi:hypothetical protein
MKILSLVFFRASCSILIINLHVTRFVFRFPSPYIIALVRLFRDLPGLFSDSVLQVLPHEPRSYPGQAGVGDAAQGQVPRGGPDGRRPGTVLPRDRVHRTHVRRESHGDIRLRAV